MSKPHMKVGAFGRPITPIAQAVLAAAPGSVFTCRDCRRSMRIWALDARRPENADVRDICLSAALSFRNGPCFHSPNKKIKHGE